MAEAGAVPAHEVTEADWGRLRAAAADALELAYAPYSGYRVGAAALTEGIQRAPARALRGVLLGFLGALLFALGADIIEVC